MRKVTLPLRVAFFIYFAMRYVFQLLIIICFAFAGEVLHTMLPLPLPASIYGIILLYAALELKIVKVRQIREVSTTLIMAMPVMFIPPAVGLLNTWEEIQGIWPQYLLITVLSTFIVMAGAGWMTQAVIRWRGKSHEKAQDNDTGNERTPK